MKTPESSAEVLCMLKRCKAANAFGSNLTTEESELLDQAIQEFVALIDLAKTGAVLPSAAQRIVGASFLRAIEAHLRTCKTSSLVTLSECTEF